MSQPDSNSGSSTPADQSDATIDLDTKLQDEIEAALGDMNIDEMLSAGQEQEQPKAAPAPQSSTVSRLRERATQQTTTRSGTIVAVHGGDVMVEFGPKTQGMCSLEQFEKPPALGEKMEFVLQRFDKDDGLYVLSRRGKPTAKAEWESLEIGQSVEARCTGVNKGGLELEIAKHRAFMPAGHVDLRHVEKLDVFIGEKMPCEVIELDRKRGKIILSRKSHLEAERKELGVKLLAELEVGQTRPAVIIRLQPYGAFADLGGIDGLIHISDMSYERIKHPSDVLKEGDQVDVKVLKIDQSGDQMRIGLGLKQLGEDPVKSAMTEIEEGATVSGKVTKLAAFGAFVELSPGVEGLIHISELSHDRINRPSQVVKPDEVVSVKVLSIDTKKRRISLSLKALKQASGKSAGGGGESLRDEDPHLRKLKAQLSAKFGDNLKGGIG